MPVWQDIIALRHIEIIWSYTPIQTSESAQWTLHKYVFTRALLKLLLRTVAEALKWDREHPPERLEQKYDPSCELT